MKKGLLVFIIATLFVFTGCSKKDTPEYAAKAFIESFMTGNVEDFKKYATDNTKTVFTFALAMKCSKQDLENNTAKCLKEIGKNIKNIEVVKTEKLSDDKAIVTLKEEYTNGKSKNEKFYVVKTKDGWKVDIKK